MKHIASGRYSECARMLNGMEKTLDKQLNTDCQRWPYPSSLRPRTLNPENRLR